MGRRDLIKSGFKFHKLLNLLVDNILGDKLTRRIVSKTVLVYDIHIDELTFYPRQLVSLSTRLLVNYES